MKNPNYKMIVALLGSAALMACFESGNNGANPTGAVDIQGAPNGVNTTPGYPGLAAYQNKLLEAKAIQEQDAKSLAANGGSNAPTALPKAASISRAVGWIKGKDACPTLFSAKTAEIRLTMDDEDSWSSEEYISWNKVNGGSPNGVGFPLDLTSHGLAIKQSTNLINSSEIHFCLDANAPTLQQASQDYATALLGDHCPIGGYKYSITIDNEDNGNANSSACVANCTGYPIDPNNAIWPGNATTGGALNGSTTLFMCFVPKTSNSGTSAYWGGHGLGVIANANANFAGGVTDASAQLQLTRQANPYRNDYTKFNFYTQTTDNGTFWTDDMKARAQSFFFYPPSSVVGINFNYNDVTF